MGTSLKVEPFPGMIENPPINVPCILIFNNYFYCLNINKEI